MHATGSLILENRSLDVHIPLATSMRISRSGSSRESTTTLSMRTKLSYSSSQPEQDILARIRRGRRFDVPVPRGTVR